MPNPHVVCRNTETPRTLDDIAIASGITSKSVGRSYRWIVNELNLKPTPPDPVKTISKIANIVQVSEKTKRKTIEFLKARKNIANVYEKNPMGIIGASLYLACISTGELKSQKEIADASGIKDSTLRNRCKDIKKFIQI